MPLSPAWYITLIAPLAAAVLAACGGPATVDPLEALSPASDREPETTVVSSSASSDGASSAWTAASTPGGSAEEAVANMLDAGALRAAPNTVLLNFLREEGGRYLPPAQQRESIIQVARALRDELKSSSQLDIMELANLGGSLGGRTLGETLKSWAEPENLLRWGLGYPTDSSERREEIQEELYTRMVEPWSRGVEIAAVFHEVGLTEDARRFYRNCLEAYFVDAEWLTERCFQGAVAMGPDAAAALFLDMAEHPHPTLLSAPGLSAAGEMPGSAEMPRVPQIEAVAVRGLGRTAAGGGLLPRRRRAVEERLLGYARSDNPEVLAAAVTAIARARPRGGERVLTQLWETGDSERIRSLAGQALAAAYRQPQARRELDDHLAELAPGAAFPLARALIDAGDAAGYRWARALLSEGGVPPDVEDVRAQVVSHLATTDSPRARRLLNEIASREHPDEWLAAWIEVALVQMGNASRVDELAELARIEDWTFGRSDVTRWFKRLRPLVWEGVKLAAGLPPNERVLLDLAFAERERYRRRAEERAERTTELRWQIADTLATVDNPAALRTLTYLLHEGEPSVRLSAARALLAQSGTPDFAALADALALDYGEQAGRSRNPEVHAALLRKLVHDHPEAAGTQELLVRMRGPDAPPSVRFMALAFSRS